MREFKTVEEAKKYGECFGKYDYEKVKIKGKVVILAGTDKVYEEDIWGSCYEILETINKKFGFNIDCADGASTIRDFILKEVLEKEENVVFVDVCDEY